MAYSSPLNLSAETWASPDQPEVIEQVKNNPELFATTLAETDPIRAINVGDLSLRGALRRLFESDAKQMAITFDTRKRLSAGTTSELVSVEVQALVLPFNLDELVARVESVLRRSNAPSNSDVARFGDVTVDFSSMEVSRSSGEQVVLTAQEFKALKFFVSNPGRVISRDELLNQAWGYDNYPCSRTVDNHILRLRQKLESDPSHPVHFRTVHRVVF